MKVIIFSSQWLKAYSEISELDIVSDKKMTGFLKRNMQRSLDKLEKQAAAAKPGENKNVQKITEGNLRDTWEKLLKPNQTFAVGLESGVITFEYQAGTYLLSSNWDQYGVYNDQCPSGNGCSNCPVGCVALAGAQIMRYWAWPPNDFDWINMPDSATDNSPVEQKNAVAYLCAEVGSEAGVDYSCGGSDAWCGDKVGKDMLDAYEKHFQFSDDAYFDLRIDNPINEDWFNIIKDNINANQPLQYCTCEFDFPGVGGHSLVLDGWKLWWSDGHFYGHMNDGNLEWVDMTDLPGAEGMIKKIKPVNCLGNWLSYDVPSFPYRYFNKDATGRNVTFAAGHNLQFLPGITVTGTSPVGDCIQFLGTPANNTRLFSIKGTSTGGLDAGVMIYDGEIRLYNTGSIKFH